MGKNNKYSYESLPESIFKIEDYGVKARLESAGREKFEGFARQSFSPCNPEALFFPFLIQICKKQDNRCPGMQNNFM